MSGGGVVCVLVFLGHWGVGLLGTPGREPASVWK